MRSRCHCGDTRQCRALDLYGRQRADDRLGCGQPRVGERVTLVMLMQKMSQSLSHFVMGKHDEGTAARRFDDNGEKLGIDSTERRVPAAL